MDSTKSAAWGHMTGAAGVVDCLRRAGVSRAFGQASVEPSWLFDAFSASSLDMVLVTHPQNAAHMADAHARLTGEPAACLLAPGPGLSQALVGIALAQNDSSPLIILVASGGAGRSSQGRGSCLSAAHLAMAEPVCKRIFQLREPEDVPSVMALAIRIAREGQPGPVLVDVPLDVQKGRARMEGTGFRPGPRLLSRKAEVQLVRAAEILSEARQVGLYVGAGCYEALDEVKELAERLDAPVATTISGMGALPWIHPLSVGFGPASAGSPLAGEALAGCDVLLAVGCRFREASAGGFTLNLKADLIHVDIEAGVAGANLSAQVAVCAPAKLALRFLVDHVPDVERPAMRRLIRDGKRSLRKALTSRPRWTDAVDPVKVFPALREVLAKEDVVVFDSGHHALYAIACYQVQSARTLIGPVDCPAAGFSVSAAIALKLVDPDGRVVACVDGAGFVQAAIELVTARRCNVAPVVVVFVDDMLKLDQTLGDGFVNRAAAVDLAPVDYELWAQSMGLKYTRIRNDAELEEGLRWALTAEAPVIVEVRVSYNETANYLRMIESLEHKRLPRAASLRLGARLIMRKLLAGGGAGGESSP